MTTSSASTADRCLCWLDSHGPLVKRQRVRLGDGGAKSELSDIAAKVWEIALLDAPCPDHTLSGYVRSWPIELCAALARCLLTCSPSTVVLGIIAIALLFYLNLNQILLNFLSLYFFSKTKLV